MVCKWYLSKALKKKKKGLPRCTAIHRGPWVSHTIKAHRVEGHPHWHLWLCHSLVFWGLSPGGPESSTLKPVEWPLHDSLPSHLPQCPLAKSWGHSLGVSAGTSGGLSISPTANSWAGLAWMSPDWTWSNHYEQTKSQPDGDNLEIAGTLRKRKKGGEERRREDRTSVERHWIHTKMKFCEANC